MFCFTAELYKVPILDIMFCFTGELYKVPILDIMFCFTGELYKVPKICVSDYNYSNSWITFI